MKKYQIPQITEIVFNLNDVILTSGDSNDKDVWEDDIFGDNI